VLNGNSQITDSHGYDGHGGRPDLDDPIYREDVMSKRVFGYLIDVCMIALISFGLWLITAMSFGLIAPITVVLQALLPFAYHIFLVSRRGATIGQKLMKLRVLSMSDGDIPTVLQALILTVLFYITVSLLFVPLLYVLFDDKGRFLHDIFSGTRTLNHTGISRPA
jgi:uncharacterized RDD family membrane protein YckC